MIRLWLFQAPSRRSRGLIDLGGQVVGAAVIGVELDHQAVMGVADLGIAGARRQPEHLIGLLARHGRLGGRAALPDDWPPACRPRQSAPLEAVEIGLHQCHALGIVDPAVLPHLQQLLERQLGEAPVAMTAGQHSAFDHAALVVQLHGEVFRVDARGLAARSARLRPGLGPQARSTAAPAAGPTPTARNTIPSGTRNSSSTAPSAAEPSAVRLAAVAKVAGSPTRRPAAWR